MGVIYTYNRGKFIFGKNSNEVNKAWQGQDSPTREVKVGDSTIWPSFTVGSVAGTFTFTPSLDSTKSQGDFTIISENGISKYKTSVKTPNNPIDENEYIEVDPAGGTGTIGIMTRESSLWHQLSLIGQIDEVKEKSDESAKIDKFTITASSSVYAGVTTGTSTYNNNNKIYTTPFTLKVNSNDNGTTKLTSQQEHDAKYMPTGNYDILLNWSIKANNNPSVAYTTFNLNGFYDLLGRNYLIPNNNKLLFKVFQKSNILYYTHLAFLTENQANNYINSGTLQTVESINVNYNVTTTTFYTFVELGISPNGGHDIYWNNAEKGSSIPDSISLTALKLSVDQPTVLNYKVDVISHSGNLFKCTITSDVNDENHNTFGMKQNYSITDKKFTNTLGDIIGGDGKASFTESANGSKVYEKFKIGRSTITKPISVNITAQFNYGHYHI